MYVNTLCTQIISSTTYSKIYKHILTFFKSHLVQHLFRVVYCNTCCNKSNEEQKSLGSKAYMEEIAGSFLMKQFINGNKITTFTSL